MNFYFNSLLTGLAFTSLAAAKTIPNHAEAGLVLGQVDFTSKLNPSPPTAKSLNFPCSVIVDPVTRKVFVSDVSNNRVLRYASANALANGAAAEVVFGQKDFTKKLNGEIQNQATVVTETQFGNEPSSLFLDARGRLWVPDFAGNRVLMFDGASLRNSGASAERVYGQPNFTTSTEGVTSAKMYRPFDVCVDSSDRLWVADGANNRVLRFDSITTKPSGAAADGVLGQASFTTRVPSTTGSALPRPTGVTISTNGVLYVTCYSGNRVMRFDNAAALAPGATANAVLGQPDFTTITLGLSAEKMNEPYGSWITQDDSLWVADAGNHRVLRFDNASTKPTGAAADGVLGQPDFITGTAATTRRGLNYPYLRPFVDNAGSLWIAEGRNSRVLRFSSDSTPPLLAVTTKVKKSTTKKAITLKGTATDVSGISKVEYRMGKGAFKLAAGTTAWSFKAKLKKGKNTLTVIATDTVGNVSVNKIIKIKQK